MVLQLHGSREVTSSLYCHLRLQCQCSGTVGHGGDGLRIILDTETDLTLPFCLYCSILCRFLISSFWAFLFHFVFVSKIDLIVIRNAGACCSLCTRGECPASAALQAASAAACLMCAASCSLQREQWPPSSRASSVSDVRGWGSTSRQQAALYGIIVDINYLQMWISWYQLSTYTS